MSPISHELNPRDVVITGLGIVSPIGIGREAFWSSLRTGRSGVRPISLFDTGDYPIRIGAEVTDFDPKAYVRPRKSLKVMSREIQFGFAAADMALADARLEDGQVEPERYGVVFGAEMIYCQLEEVEAACRQCLVEGEFDRARWGAASMSEVFPLWLLRNLPNMVACHVAIAHDARAPNNTIGHGDVSALAAIAEAARVIQRGAADVMIAGGTGARIHPTSIAFRGPVDLSRRNDEPERALRPFDADRDGTVHGEGAAAIVLESREHAEGRRARILARLASCASAHESVRDDAPLSGSAVRRVIEDALRQAEVRPEDLSHVNAHGLGAPIDDRYEAQAIAGVLGDVPVTAPKSFLGHSGAGCGALELVASLIGLEEHEVPMTLNYETPDPECPVNVVHERPLRADAPAVIKLNTSRLGQAAALVIVRED